MAAVHLRTPFVPHHLDDYSFSAGTSLCCCAKHFCLDTRSPKAESPFYGLLLSFASSTEERPWPQAAGFAGPGSSSCYFCSCRISVLLTGINLPKLGRPSEVA